MSNDFQKVLDTFLKPPKPKPSPAQKSIASKLEHDVVEALNKASRKSDQTNADLNRSATGRKVTSTSPMSWRALPDGALKLPGDLSNPSLEREMYNYDMQNFGVATLGYRERVPKGMEARWKARMQYRGKMQAKLTERLGQQEKMDRQASAPYMPEDLEEATRGMRDPLESRLVFGANPIVQAWTVATGGKMDNPLAMTEYALKTAPTIGTDTDVDLGLRAASALFNDPLGYSRAATGDARTVNELPGWAQVVESVGNVVPQLAASYLTGGGGSAAGIGKIGNIIANSALFDLPAYATMAKDMGGIGNAAMAMAQSIGKAFDPSATPAERTQGGIVLAGLGLGAYGKLAKPKPKLKPGPRFVPKSDPGYGPDAPLDLVGMQERRQAVAGGVEKFGDSRSKARFQPKETGTGKSVSADYIRSQPGYAAHNRIGILALLRDWASSPKSLSDDDITYFNGVSEHVSSRNEMFDGDFDSILTVAKANEGRLDVMRLYGNIARNESASPATRQKAQKLLDRWESKERAWAAKEDAKQTKPQRPKARFQPKEAEGHSAGEPVDLRGRAKPVPKEEAPKPRTAEAEAKEPWEVTRAQRLGQIRNKWQEEIEDVQSQINDLARQYPNITKGNLTRKRDSSGLVKGAPIIDKLRRQIIPLEHHIDELKAKLERTAESDTLNHPAFVRAHKNEVRKALSEGKPVPKEVLADYPDLAPKPKPQPKPRPSQGTGAAKPTTEAPRLVANRVAPKPKPVEGAVKEPWEYTVQEWDDSARKYPFEENRRQYESEFKGIANWMRSEGIDTTGFDSVEGFIHDMLTSDRKWTKGRATGLTPRQRLTLKGRFGNTERAETLRKGLLKLLDLKEQKGVQLPTAEESARSRDFHKRSVERAHAEGKPVPAEVLADYPDLQPKPKPRPSQGTGTAKPTTEAPRLVANRVAPEKSKPAYGPQFHARQVEVTSDMDLKALLAAISRGMREGDANAIRGMHEAFSSNRDTIKTMLNKTLSAAQLKNIVTRSGTKSEMIGALTSAIERRFMLDDSIGYDPLKETLSSAIGKRVASLTDDDLAKHRAKVDADRAQREKTLTNPETLSEFSQFVQAKGRSALSDEQWARYDDLLAKAQAKAPVKSEPTGNVEFSVKESVHTKGGYPIHIVQMSSRVSRDQYLALSAKAKELGGYYSSYGSKDNHGFIFKTKEGAQSFIEASSGVSAKSESAEAPVKASASTKLRGMADKIEAAAKDSLSQDRRTNTRRQADMAGNAIANANENLALAATMRNVADALDKGKAVHLAGLTTKAQILTIEAVIRAAKNRALRAAGVNSEKWSSTPATSAMMENAQIPWPWVHRQTIMELMAKKVPGTVNILKNMLGRTTEQSGGVTLDSWSLVEDLQKVKQLVAKRHPGSVTRLNWSAEPTEALRLKSMGIETPAQMRAAARELLEAKGEVKGIDPVKAKEMELKFSNIPGFFPTPEKIVTRMLDEAGIEPGMRVLEPSAGKGDIADAATAAGGRVDVVEYNHTLNSLLKEKGMNVVGSDALETTGKYDRVLMNPPFENGADIDHVRYAYENNLAPGGRLVAIMSEGPFFRSDKKAVAFREWLESVGGVSEPLPEGSFKDSFKTTGVNTRLVTIDAPSPTKAQAVSKIKDGLKKFGDIDPDGPMKAGSGWVPFTDRQLEGLREVAQGAWELAKLTGMEAMAHAKNAMKQHWSPQVERWFQNEFELYRNPKAPPVQDPNIQRATREAVEAPAKKDAVAKEEIAPPTTLDSPAGATDKPAGATGMARQFEDPERSGAGKSPTKGSGVDPKALAESGERSYKSDPLRVAKIVDEAHKSNRVLTEIEIAEVTAYKRDLVNKMNRIESAAMDKDSFEHYNYAQMDAVLDKISDLAQTSRSKFHSLGMALQTAFNADFSVAELARKARVFMGEDLSGEFKAKFDGLQTKYAEALKDLEAARAKIESMLKTGMGTKGAGRNLKASAARRLQDMGFTYAGEPIPKTGGMGSKKRGAARIPGMDANAAKAINDYVRGLIYEDGYHGIDDLVSRVQKSFPQLTEGHVLSALSGEYASAKKRMDVGRVEAIKTFNEVKRVAEYRRLTRMRKIGSNLKEIFTATNRAFQTGLDVSAPFIQGLPTLAAHPKIWLKAWKPMLEAAAKGGKFVDEHYSGIVEDARYPDAKTAGLDLSMPGGSFSAQEEMFAGAIARRMAGSKIYGIRQVGQLIERSEAAFTVYMNEVRWGVYKKLAALDPGNPDYLKDVARMVNIATGKGHGALANKLKSSDVAGNVLYAPRYTLSQFQLAGEPIALLSGAYKTSKGKKVAALEYAKIAGTIALTGAVVEMMGGDVERDPRSTDFGRWKLPNGVTMNVFGRVSDPIKLLSQVFWGRISQAGEYTDAGDFGAADFWTVMKSKASPALRAASMAATGQTYDQRTGNRNVALWEFGTENFTPIGAREIAKTLADPNSTRNERIMSATQLLGVDSKRTPERTGKAAPPMGMPTGLKRMLGMEPPKKKKSKSVAPGIPKLKLPSIPSAPF